MKTQECASEISLNRFQQCFDGDPSSVLACQKLIRNLPENELMLPATKDLLTSTHLLLEVGTPLE